MKPGDVVVPVWNPEAGPRPAHRARVIACDGAWYRLVPIRADGTIGPAFEAHRDDIQRVRS